MQDGLKGQSCFLSFPFFIFFLTQSIFNLTDWPTSSSSLGLIAKTATVQQDCAKAESENVMLQQYIDSVTKSLAAKS